MGTWAMFAILHGATDDAKPCSISSIHEYGGRNDTSDLGEARRAICWISGSNLSRSCYSDHNFAVELRTENLTIDISNDNSQRSKYPIACLNIVNRYFRSKFVPQRFSHRASVSGMLEVVFGGWLFMRFFGYDFLGYFFGEATTQGASGIIVLQIVLRTELIISYSGRHYKRCYRFSTFATF